MSYPDPSKNLRGDSQFLARLRDGDESAFNLLVRTYGGSLIGHASRIVGSVDSAREVVQDVFLEVWRNREHVQSHWDISAYIYGLTRRRAMNVAAANKSTGQREYLWVTEMTEGDVLTGSTVADEDACIRTMLWNALLELSPRCREIFMLVWDRQLSYSVIAQQLGISESTVRGHMSRAMQHLAEVLGPGGKL